MGKKDQRFTVSLDEESAALLQRIAEELTEDNRSQAARRAIQTAARVLLDPTPATGRLARSATHAHASAN